VRSHTSYQETDWKKQKGGSQTKVIENVCGPVVQGTVPENHISEPSVKQMKV